MCYPKGLTRDFWKDWVLSLLMLGLKGSLCMFLELNYSMNFYLHF